MHNLKIALYASCALAAPIVATFAAHAQETPQSTEDRASDGSSRDIVVTARRRAESNLDVPIAITALSAESLSKRGVERVDDLARVAPSISFRSTAGRRSNSQYEIRGVSSTESLITGDPAVGVYVDEVYRARATGTNQSFYDIENVQILYGPQGTLFGRNSSAGAVLITTKRPTQEFEASINAGYGNYDRMELTGMVNIPLGDKLAVRLAGQRVKRNGVGRNVTTGRDIANINSWSGRASILFEPFEGVRNTLIGSYYKADENGSIVFINGFRPCPSATATSPATSCSRRSMPDVPTVDTRTIGNALAEAWAAQQRRGPWQTALDSAFRDFRGRETLNGDPALSLDPIENTRNLALTNVTEIELSDDITLKNIFGYNKVQLIAANDLDGTPLKLVDTYLNSQVSQYSDELQLQGETGGLNWVFGGMYFREKGHDLQNSTQNIYTETRTDVIGINKSVAVFAQGTYKLTDQLSVTAGGRYTWDKRFVRYNSPVSYALAENTLVRPATFTCQLSPVLDPDRDCLLDNQVSFKQPTYTLSVDYKPTRDLLFYVAHRLGYRSGGLQARTGLVASGPAVGGVTPVANIPPYGPEKVRDVELGFKGDMSLGGDVRLTTSIALYRAWYKGVQRSTNIATGLSATTTPVGPATTTGITSIGSAKVQGVTVEGNLTLVRGFNIGGFFGYIDGKYTTFRTATAVFRNLAFGTSKYSMGVNFNMMFIDTPEVGQASFSGNYSYRTKYTVDQTLPLVEPESFAPAQHNLNLALGWDNISGSQFSAQAWVRNVTNESQVLGITALAGSLGFSTGVRGEPRTYGLNIGYKF